MGASACSADPAVQEQMRLRRELRIRNRVNDDRLANWKKEHAKQHGLLLLGLPEAGKSTFIHQIMDIYKLTSDGDARRPYVTMITRFCINSLQMLVQQSETLAIEQPALGTLTSAASIVSVAYIKALAKDTSEITTETAYHMKLLWADQGIQNTFSHRHQFQLSDSVRYFLDRIDDVRRPGYIPSEMDLQQRRIGMGCIDEVHFEIEADHFVLVNTAELPRKQLNLFQYNFTAAIFVVAVNEYDQVQDVDGESVNSLAASMNLFKSYCESPLMKDVPVLVFLNKRDLFKEKIGRVPLRNHFPEYGGEKTDEAATAWIAARFIDLATDRKVYVQQTCATNVDNVQYTFKDVAIRQRLKECGLLY